MLGVLAIRLGDSILARPAHPRGVHAVDELVVHAAAATRPAGERHPCREPRVAAVAVRLANQRDELPHVDAVSAPRANGLVHAILEPAAAEANQRVDETVLAAEVVMDGGVGEPEIASDRLDLDGAGSLLDQPLFGRLEDGATRFVGAPESRRRRC